MSTVDATAAKERHHIAKKAIQCQRRRDKSDLDEDNVKSIGQGSA